MSKGDFSNIKKKKKVDVFIDGASSNGNEKTLDPRAKRDFKSIRLGFNEYEYNLLETAALDANLSLVAFVRRAWMLEAKKGS